VAVNASQQKALFFALCVGLSISWVAPVALAETTANYMSIEATADKPVQVSYHASAHRSNCTPGALPTIRVKEPPKSGVLSIRKAMLTTSKVAGCPPIKTPAQVVFYQARQGYAGPDHLTYEVTSENGEVTTYDVTVTVKETPAPSKPGETPKPL
jgi:hypothetical protein